MSKYQKLHIRKGDTVKIIAGNDRGKQGVVLEIIPSRQRAFVEGMNMVTRHTKPSASKPEGGIEKVEAPIHVSNLMVVEPASGEPTRIGRRRNDKGKLQRYSRKTGEFIKNG